MIHNILYINNGSSSPAFTSATKYPSTLLTTHWVCNTQLILITEVTEDSIIFAGPEPGFVDEWEEYGILCTSQESGAIEFTCETVPEDDIDINILVLNYHEGGGSEPEPEPEPYVPPTWSGGTDEEIVEALEKHYAGEIDLTEYWSVGDEREIQLGAMSATNVGESHVAQTVTLVLVNIGGKDLVTAENGITECVFIWQLKNCLANGTTLEGGYMNSTRTNSGGWNTAARRTWCNNVFYNALPQYMKTITKQVQNISTIGDKSSTTATTNDYCAIPACIELGYASGTYVPASEGSAWSYYTSNNDRIKKAGNTGSAQTWWTRTPNMYGSTSFCPVKTDGSRGGNNDGYAEVIKGIAPFGCL